MMNGIDTYNSTTINYLYTYGEVARRLLLIAGGISLQGVVVDSMLSFPSPSNIMYADAVLHVALFTNFMISLTSVSICTTNNAFTIRLITILCGVLLAVLCGLWVNVVWWTAFSLIAGTISDMRLVSYSKLSLSILVSGMVSFALLIYFKNRNFLQCCCCMLQASQPVRPAAITDHEASSHQKNYGTILPSPSFGVSGISQSHGGCKSYFSVGDKVLARLDNRPVSLWYPATVATVLSNKSGPGSTGSACVYDIVFYDGEVSRNRAGRDIMHPVHESQPPFFEDYPLTTSSNSVNASSGNDAQEGTWEEGAYRDSGGIHQTDGWIVFIYIHLILGAVTIALFSVAYLNSATLTGESMSKAFVGSYVAVAVGYATVSLAAIITAFQDYAAVLRAVVDGSLAAKIEFALFVVESLVARSLEPQLSEEKPKEEFDL